MAGLFAGDADRRALLAGLGFIDGVAADWNAPELFEWFSGHAPLLGCARAPAVVSDAVLGTLELARAGRPAAASEEMARLLDTARRRVTFTLRGLLAVPGDDRFLQAA